MYEKSCSTTLISVGGDRNIHLSLINLHCCLAPAGLPGNDDQAAMASLLSFHLLGLYPGQNTT